MTGRGEHIANKRVVWFRCPHTLNELHVERWPTKKGSAPIRVCKVCGAWRVGQEHTWRLGDMNKALRLARAEAAED